MKKVTKVATPKKIDLTKTYVTVKIRSYAHGMNFDNLVEDISTIQSYLKAGFKFDISSGTTLEFASSKPEAFFGDISLNVAADQFKGNPRQIAGKIDKFVTDGNLILEEREIDLYRDIKPKKVTIPANLVVPEWIPKGSYIVCDEDCNLYLVNAVPVFYDGRLEFDGPNDGFFLLGSCKKFIAPLWRDLKPGEYVRLR